MRGLGMEEGIVVVGGGLAGLAASVLLARAGHQVSLYEKSAALGGRGNTKEIGGYFFNLGPHSLYLEEGVTSILAELGIRYSGQSPDRAKQRIEINGELGQFPNSIPSILQNELLDENSRNEILRIFSVLGQEDTSRWRGHSVLDWIESFSVKHPQTVLIIESMMRLATYCADPGLVDAEFFLNLLRSMPDVWYLDHGWGTLISGMEQAAREAGVHIVFNANVIGIREAEQGYHLSFANGTQLEASTVVAAVAPASVKKLVEGEKFQELRSWAENTIPIYAAVLNIALKRLPQKELSFVLGVDTPYYYSVHSDVANLAPSGGAIIHLMKYIRSNESLQPGSTREDLKIWLDTIQPGWRDWVVEEQFFPKLMVAGDVIQSVRGGLPGRYGPKVPGVSNFFVVGDWVGNEAQLANASLVSAYRAASMILEDLA